MAFFEMHIINYRVLWFLFLTTLLGKTDSKIWPKIMKITGERLTRAANFHKS